MDSLLYGQDKGQVRYRSYQIIKAIKTKIKLGCN